MPKNTNKSRKIEEIQDFSKDLKTEGVRINPAEYSGKKVKCKFLTMICADYGTFMSGEVGEIPEVRAKELELLNKCEVLKSDNNDVNEGGE